MAKGVYRHGNRFRCQVWVNGKRKWKDLGEDESAAIELHADLMGKSDSTLASAIRRYKREVMPGKAEKTQKDQKRQIEKLNRVFGHMEPSEITQPMVIQYLDMRGNVAGNREIALLRHIITKCVHWGMASYNQLRGMQYRNPEGKRERDVTAKELRWVMRRAKPRERYLMWLVYLTGLRRADVLALTSFNMKTDGIHLVEQKTGKRVRIESTPSLEKVVRRLLKIGTDSRLFPITDSGIDDAWQRLRKKLKQQDYDLFQLKDLRAAHAGEIEDAGGDATRQLGHSSRSVTQKHYLRKGRKVVPIR